mmetsp:Transcript_7187/g.31790  ORF Transcript_7187/g.31790 Transcript_7187/m.31790 type:complete len:247 (-) Transcript_7187:1355-2095(-)
MPLLRSARVCFNHHITGHPLNFFLATAVLYVQLVRELLVNCSLKAFGAVHWGANLHNTVLHYEFLHSHDLRVGETVRRYLPLRVFSRILIGRGKRGKPGEAQRESNKRFEQTISAHKHSKLGTYHSWTFWPLSFFRRSDGYHTCRRMTKLVALFAACCALSSERRSIRICRGSIPRHSSIRQVINSNWHRSGVSCPLQLVWIEQGFFEFQRFYRVFHSFRVRADHMFAFPDPQHPHTFQNHTYILF